MNMVRPIDIFSLFIIPLKRLLATLAYTLPLHHLLNCLKPDTAKPNWFCVAIFAFLIKGFISGFPLLNYLLNDICSVTVVQRSCREPAISVAQLNIMTELWFQIRVTLLKCIPVEKWNEGIQIAIIRTVDPSAIINHKLVLFIRRVLKIYSGEQLRIVSLNWMWW